MARVRIARCISVAVLCIGTCSVIFDFANTFLVLGLTIVGTVSYLVMAIQMQNANEDAETISYLRRALDTRAKRERPPRFDRSAFDRLSDEG